VLRCEAPRAQDAPCTAAGCAGLRGIRMRCSHAERKRAPHRSNAISSAPPLPPDVVRAALLQPLPVAPCAAPPAPSCAAVPATVPAFAAPAVRLTPPAAVAHAELQSYDISPYKSGSDRRVALLRTCGLAIFASDLPMLCAQRRGDGGRAPAQGGALLGAQVRAHARCCALQRGADWHRHSEALAPVLYAQAKADPDSIFQNPSKTCRCVIPASDALPVRC
jgi:hypothetical protein